MKKDFITLETCIPIGIIKYFVIGLISISKNCYPEHYKQNNLLTHSNNKLHKKNKIELGIQTEMARPNIGLHSLITPNLGNQKNSYPIRNLALNYETYIIKGSNGKRTYFLGLGTCFRNSLIFGDSFSYKSNYFSLDILNRFYLGQDFYFRLGISPILINEKMIKSRLPNTNQDWKLYTNQISNAIFEFGFGFNITKNNEFQLSYLYIPNSFYHSNIPNSFIEYGLMIKL